MFESVGPGEGTGGTPPWFRTTRISGRPLSPLVVPTLVVLGYDPKRPPTDDYQNEATPRGTGSRPRGGVLSGPKPVFSPGTGQRGPD